MGILTLRVSLCTFKKRANSKTQNIRYKSKRQRLFRKKNFFVKKCIFFKNGREVNNL